MVYNDETHTFDYVIKVLQRAVSCSASQASDHATIIDREVGIKRFSQLSSLALLNNKLFSIFRKEIRKVKR